MDGRMRTAQLARAAGYSVQQVRDLERLGVVPAAVREDNGYRRFTEEHLAALRAYRGLARAVGPVVARRLVPELRTLPADEAAARLGALHVGLAAERRAALDALAALDAIRAEAGDGPDGDPDDSGAMSITTLAEALGVRTSTLRFWEKEGLVTPDRVTSLRARRYRTAAIREARVTAALRAAGYGIPAVRRTVEAIRRVDDLAEPAAALRTRLDDITRRTVALLEAGAALATLVVLPARPVDTG